MHSRRLAVEGLTLIYLRTANGIFFKKTGLLNLPGKIFPGKFLLNFLSKWSEISSVFLNFNVTWSLKAQTVSSKLFHVDNEESI